jgi:hypothetical protein
LLGHRQHPAAKEQIPVDSRDRVHTPIASGSPRAAQIAQVIQVKIQARVGRNSDAGGPRLLVGTTREKFWVE